MDKKSISIKGKLLIDQSCEYAKSQWLDYFQKVTGEYQNICSFKDCSSLADQVGQFNLKNYPLIYSYITPICSNCSLFRYDNIYYDLKDQISCIRIEYNEYCKFCISTIDQLLKYQ